MDFWRQVAAFLSLATCVVCLSCGSDTRATDETAIRAASREWNQAEAAKDLDKCVSFYTEDGERFATGSPLIRGAAALRKEWASYLAVPGSFTWATSKVEVARSGDLAYETGTFALKTQTATTNGKYVLVWKKQNDGKWKVAVDIDNPDR